MALYKVRPIFKEMLWGGTQLSKHFDFKLPSSKIGEAWVVSAHHNGDCVIENGEFLGKTLSEVYASHRDRFGQGENKKFPLIIKIIDANKDLSIQVHPDDELAYKVGDQSGKTECWYVLDCMDNTSMILGHTAQSQKDLYNALEKNEIKSIVNRFLIKKDDFYVVPAGTIHSIGAGSLIYEIQQSSDTTYRLYDYERKDKNGETRELHLKEGIRAVKFENPSNLEKPKEISMRGILITDLVDNDYFKVSKLSIRNEGLLNLSDSSYIIGVIDGKAEINGLKLFKGDHVITTREEKELKISGECILMITLVKTK